MQAGTTRKYLSVVAWLTFASTADVVKCHKNITGIEFYNKKSISLKYHRYIYIYIFTIHIFFTYACKHSACIKRRYTSHVYYICNTTVIAKAYNYISNFTITATLTNKNYQLNIVIRTIISQNIFYSLRLCNVDCWVYNILVF